MEIDKALEIAGRLKELREKNTLSVKDMSRLMGVTKSYWYSLERGSKSVSRSLLNKLIEHFGVSADWLLSGSPSIDALDKINDEGIKKKVTGVFLRDLTEIIPLVEMFLQVKTLEKSLLNQKRFDLDEGEINGLLSPYFEFKHKLEIANIESQSEEMNRHALQVLYYYQSELRNGINSLSKEFLMGIEKGWIKISRNPDSEQKEGFSLDKLYSKWVRS